MLKDRNVEVADIASGRTEPLGRPKRSGRGRGTG